MIDNETFTLKELVFAFVLLIGMGILKFLGFIMPKTAEIVADYYSRKINNGTNKKIEDLIVKVDILENDLADRNGLMEEIKICKKAIISQDKELLELVRQNYINKVRNNQKHEI